MRRGSGRVSVEARTHVAPVARRRLRKLREGSELKLGERHLRKLIGGHQRRRKVRSSWLLLLLLLLLMLMRLLLLRLLLLVLLVR